MWGNVWVRCILQVQSRQVVLTMGCRIRSPTPSLDLLSSTEDHSMLSLEPGICEGTIHPMLDVPTRFGCSADESSMDPPPWTGGQQNGEVSVDEEFFVEGNKIMRGIRAWTDRCDGRNQQVWDQKADFGGDGNGDRWATQESWNPLLLSAASTLGAIGSAIVLNACSGDVHDGENISLMSQEESLLRIPGVIIFRDLPALCNKCHATLVFATACGCCIASTICYHQLHKRERYKAHAVLTAIVCTIGIGAIKGQRAFLGALPCTIIAGLLLSTMIETIWCTNGGNI